MLGALQLPAASVAGQASVAECVVVPRVAGSMVVAASTVEEDFTVAAAMVEGAGNRPE